MVAHGDAHVLHLREYLEAVLAAFAPGAGGLHAAKRLAQVAHVLGVDEHHARFDVARQTQHFADVPVQMYDAAILHVVRRAALPLRP